MATEDIIEVGPVPAAITRLAASMKPVATHLDVAAGFSVGSARQAPVAPVAPVTAPVSLIIASFAPISLAAATELAIDVDDAVVTTLKTIQ